MFDQYQSHFQVSIPKIPGAKYAHFVVLRETDSYAVFKTDGELNVARVRAGLDNTDIITRIVLFKRKQTTPERLTGRELLRRYGVYEQITSQYDRLDKSGKPKKLDDCTYNDEPCGGCPDCVIYGYAVSESGSEKSKVFIDSAYAVPTYEESHQTLTLNAPYEDGTMTSGVSTTNRFSEQDHVLPEVIFPSVVTLRDPTPNTFLYVLNNLYRTKRYGAQTTRTGQVRNHLIGIVFADGDIFSNLRLTQKLYDLFKGENPPYAIAKMQEKAEQAIEELIQQDGVLYNLIKGESLASLKQEADAVLSDQAKFTEWLNSIAQETLAYAETAKVLKRK